QAVAVLASTGVQFVGAGAAPGGSDPAPDDLDRFWPWMQNVNPGPTNGGQHDDEAGDFWPWLDEPGTGRASLEPQSAQADKGDGQLVAKAVDAVFAAPPPTEAIPSAGPTETAGPAAEGPAI